jgi:hypothetical protein
MTMIARIDMYPPSLADQVLRVYVADELAAVATPIDSLYFLTIQSDKSGTLRFELNGETLIPVGTSGSRDSEISYSPNAHAGSLKAPVILRPAENTGVYKILENDHVVIIRNGERYDVTGKKL